MGHEIAAGNAVRAASSPLAEAKERQQGGASRGSRGGHHARASAGRQGASWCCVGPALRGQGGLRWHFPVSAKSTGLRVPSKGKFLAKVLASSSSCGCLRSPVCAGIDISNLCLLKGSPKICL